MAICENCFNRELCSSISLNKFGVHIIPQDECCNFKDRSRFVELLCKQGDIVYHYCEELHEILNYTVYIINVFSENSIIYRADSYDEENEEALSEIEFESKDIGRTVFLTKEQAEQALKRCEGND